MRRSGKKIYSWIGCCLLSITGLMAQSLILEQVHIHTDRSLYASGETIWLKLYVTDALAFRPTALSNIVYVELWNTQGEIIFQTKVFVEKGLGTATIALPPNQKTGEYLIRAYTRWMANGAPNNFAHQAIVIFNPTLPIPVRDTSQLPLDFKDIFTASPANKASSPSPTTLNMDLVLNKTQIESREQVQLEISTTDAQGSPVSANLSLSIAKAFPLPQVIASPYVYRNSPDTTQKTETNQLPDLYGLNLSGSVVNELGQAVGGARVLLCLPGRLPVIQYATSTPEGWFRFLLPKVYGNHEILIAATDSNGNGLPVRLDTDILGGRPQLPDWSLTFPPEVVAELQRYSLQRHIQQAYSSTQPESSIKPEIPQSPFYQAPDQVYILTEYTRFSMAETFPEIVYSVSLHRQQERPYARVNNAQTGQMMKGDPLLMIDGVPVPQMSALLALSSKEVERIEVVTSPYYLYGQIYDGIIHAITFQGDASKVSLPDGTLRRPYAFLAPKRTFPRWQPEQVPASYADRIPDMRRLLLWDPVIQTNEQGKAQVSFWTSDITGQFEIQIQGLTEEGSWGKKRVDFRVVGKTP